MDERVVNFADMAFKLRGKRYFPDGSCKHRHVTLDDEGGIVECTDCGKQLDAYITLRSMCEVWEKHAREVSAAAVRVNEDAKKILHLRAAKRVEQAWRRGMGCCCPHCHKSIFAEDGLGGVTESREYAEQRLKIVGSEDSATSKPTGETNG